MNYEFEIEDTTIFETSVLYLDILIEKDIYGNLTTTLLYLT